MTQQAAYCLLWHFSESPVNWLLMIGYSDTVSSMKLFRLPISHLPWKFVHFFLPPSLSDREDAGGRQVRREHEGLQRDDGRRRRWEGQGERHYQVPQGEFEVRTFVDLFTSSIHESRSAKFRICISESERQLLLGLFHVGLKWNNVHFLSDFTNLNEYFTFFILQSCSSGKIPAEAPVGKVRCTRLVTDYQCKSWTKTIFRSRRRECSGRSSRSRAAERAVLCLNRGFIHMLLRIRCSESQKYTCCCELNTEPN